MQSHSFRGSRGVRIPGEGSRAARANGHRRHRARGIQGFYRVIGTKHGRILKRAVRASFRARTRRLHAVHVLRQLDRGPSSRREELLLRFNCHERDKPKRAREDERTDEKRSARDERLRPSHLSKVSFFSLSLSLSLFNNRSNSILEDHFYPSTRALIPQYSNSVNKYSQTKKTALDVLVFVWSFS